MMGKSFTTGMAQGVAKPRNRRDRKKFDPIAAAYQNAKAEALRNGASEEEATAIGNKAQEEFLAKRAKERERRKMLTSGSSTTQAPQRKSKGGAVKKPAMMYGGMANNKKHMYSAGGSVKDNPGLKALAKQRPDVVAKMMKG
jgi:hypothetical protein